MGYVVAVVALFVASSIAEPGRDIPAIMSFIREVQEASSLDVLFILDSSVYVSEAEFYNMERHIARQVLQHFLYVAPERTRVALLTYAQSVKTIFDDITTDTPQLKCNFVDNMDQWLKTEYLSQETSTSQSNLAEAFQQARSIMSAGRTKRKTSKPPYLKQVVLLLTAGRYQNSSEKDEARRQGGFMQIDGVMLHAVAVGNNPDFNTIRDILLIKDFISYATDWNNAFTHQYNNIASRYNIGRTTAGAAGGRPCVFPFLYKSRLYTSCTRADYHEPWCATSAVYSKSEWAVCIVDTVADLRAYTSPDCSCHSGTSCVCNVLTGFSSCLCPAGQTMTENGCNACPNGTYKSAYGNNECNICPPGGTTATGATSQHACLCSGAACVDECLVRDHCTGNRQECVTSSDGLSVQCQCMTDYVGYNCDSNIDQCTPTTCSLGTACVDGRDDYVCVCDRDRHGKNCTEYFTSENACATVQCTTNSYCYVVNGHPVCLCRDGYMPSHSQCVEIPNLSDPPNPTTPTTAMITPTITESYNNDDGNNNINNVDNDSNPKSPEVGVVGDAENSPPAGSVSIRSHGFRREEMLLIIIIPAGVVVFIAVASTIYALCSVSRQKHNQKRQEQQYSRSESRTTDTTSNVTMFTTSTTLSMSDLKKKHEGFDVNMDTIYGNEPVEYGMGEWYYYTLDLIHNQILNTVAIVRLDGKKWILSPGCYLFKDEIEHIYSALSQKSINVRLFYQRREYGVINNNDMLMIAHSTCKDGVQQEILCATKTRQFVVICTAEFIHDNGKCKDELQRLREHIKAQGL